MLSDCMTSLLCLRKIKPSEINPHQVTSSSSEAVTDLTLGLHLLIAYTHLCTSTSAVLTEHLSYPIAPQRLRPTKI